VLVLATCLTVLLAHGASPVRADTKPHHQLMSVGSTAPFSAGGPAGEPFFASDVPLDGETLSVTKSGSGSGTVTSSPAGIDCGSTCSSSSYGFGATVTLTATPAAGSRFVSWSSNCTFPLLATCTVTMNQAQNVTVTFDVIYENLEVQNTGLGSGTVTVNPVGTACVGFGSATCYQYPYDTTVTLTAIPAVGSTVTGWDGSCVGTGTGPCTLALNEGPPLGVYLAGAIFGQLEALTVTKSGSGAGLVSSDDGGISCGSTCSHFYEPGTKVGLLPTPAAGSTFVGWSGDLCYYDLCVLVMNTPYTVTATFAKIVCVVPDLKGKSLSAAKRDIRRSHCKVGAVTQVFSTTTTRGKVVSQSPGRGERLKDGARVALVVSKGKRP
jgi:hypothetical protein